MLGTSEARLAQARMLLEGRGIVAADLLAPEVSASWQRCLQAGLDPAARPPPIEDDPAPEPARMRHAHALHFAVAEMRGLYRQIAGTHFLIAFASPDGVLLEAMGDPSFRASAEGAAIRPGTIWTEIQRGTNALGTVAATGRPVIVHGAEHFYRDYTGLTCMAAPVFGPDGKLAGVLDASSDCRSRQAHTRALVAMAAAQIENGLVRAQPGGDVLLAFHSRAEYVHTLRAGLLALGADGDVRGANSASRALLARLPVLQGVRFEALFETPWRRLLDGTGELLSLRDRSGATYVAARIRAPERPRRPLPSAAPPSNPAGFVADDPSVRQALRTTEMAARQGVPVLIRGPSGSGKEELARHAHAISGRRGAFVPINCAAIADSLAEAELFGHAPGAFTGARRGGAAGLVVEADGGTLFLDEVSELKPELQGLFLRLLDDWVVRPVGGGRSRKVDVLLLAATNADLARAVAQNRFRADLYWRLNVVEVVLPPLASRTDRDAVAAHLAARMAPGLVLSAEVRAWIARQSWPGNMRELRSALTRLALTGSPAAASPIGEVEPPGQTLRGNIDAQILNTYRAAGRNVSRSARLLGVSRNTIYRALRRAAAGTTEPPTTG
ncbi:MAG TPA: sigma-54-dependent Fis family transcriptional regulator [Acetobacteraceae bacterium]|nr:sigma-54-dependent Fis family transcriptional regulator [Acetobacteraceae bacterium]